MDTIFALATSPGKAGVAVIRISGPFAQVALQRFCGNVPPPRRLSLRTLRAKDGTVIDQALVAFFEEKQSFTGEPVVELHTHGSVAIVKSLLAELSEIDALRLADPGEFTRRALANGRLDLAQVEALGDLIAAETEAQRKQAMNGFEGALGGKVEQWRLKLIRAAALIEATIDFAEEDVPEDVSPEVSALLTDVKVDLAAEIAGAPISERIRQGFEVAIVGPPNAGKSTLLNSLAGREVAITSEVAGTTRDVIEVRMDLRGLPVTLLDTAGLRETDDLVEGIGVRRASERARAADLRVFLLSDRNEAPGLEVLDDDIVVLGKSDTGNGGSVSGRTGEGLSELIERIAVVLEARAAGASLATHARHREAIARARDLLNDADREDGAELTAHVIREATAQLESLIGRVGVEDYLDVVFREFCLGK